MRENTYIDKIDAYKENFPKILQFQKLSQFSKYYQH